MQVICRCWGGGQMKSYEYLLVEATAAVSIITMNRPERRNALSLALMDELIDCLKSLGQQPEIRVIILAANGPAFSAGHDLSELFDRSLAEYRRVFEVCTELMTLIQSVPQPVIAEVSGIATAAGCQLVASCDLAFVSDE